MDKLDPTNNKIWESFENQLPDELPLDLIWENISEKLDSALTEETEKVKQSFEHGFEQELLPVLLWADIAEKLDTTPVSEGYKIKESFETFYKDEVPNDIWDSLENHLEVESVWNRVHQSLNQNTQKHYWREKFMQVGIAVLALFWLRGCGVGEQFGKVFSTENDPIGIVSNEVSKESLLKNNVKANSILPNEQNSKNQLNKQALEQTQGIKLQKKSKKDDLKTKKDDSFVGENYSEDASHSKKYVKGKSAKQNYRKNNLIPEGSKNEAVPHNHGVPTKEQKANEKKIANDLAVQGIHSNGLMENKLSNDLSIVQDEKISLPRLVASDAISTLTGAFIPNQDQDTGIDTDRTFYIKNKNNKFKPHFEIGVVGKVGTSVLLCGATHQALKSESMLKTQMRLAGAAGLTFHAFLTKNDAIVVGLYPFSSHQQYFGGYTRDGRFYNKEIKLAYFDFSVGYQRTLLNYNKRKKVPSALYLRLEYNLGYLHQSEELVDKQQLKASNSYKQINHSVGLSLGNTHRIRRFAIDYGIYANVGLNSVSDTRKSMPVLEAPQLMNMGGYIGLRYRL